MIPAINNTFTKPVQTRPSFKEAKIIPFEEAAAKIRAKRQKTKMPMFIFWVFYVPVIYFTYGFTSRK